MRTYEELYIVRPDATEEEVEATIEQVRAVVTSHGGDVSNVEKWGVRRLAYPLQKRYEGFYVLVNFTAANSATVKELERRMRVQDDVLKFLTVRTDERMKRVLKRRKAREARAARRPAPTLGPPVAQPVAPAHPAAPEAPAKPASPTPGAPAATEEPQTAKQSAAETARDTETTRSQEKHGVVSEEPSE